MFEKTPALEEGKEGYCVGFDHRKNPDSRVETETPDGLTIRSYVLPVMQERPSAVRGAIPAVLLVLPNTEPLL